MLRRIYLCLKIIGNIVMYDNCRYLTRGVEDSSGPINSNRGFIALLKT
jgi:hypothetical protein